MKKTLSVLLLLAMLVSLFAGLTLTSNAANYAYNNGKRGQVCTSLSSAAQAYWTGSYSYATLSAKSGDSLRTSLRSKITSNRTTVGYSNLQNYFIYTDAYQGSSSQVMLFYAGIPTSSTWAGTANWNREHMWPDSLGGNAMEGDLHSMRPTDPKANSTRSNNKYGNAGSGAKECYTFDNSYHSATLAGHYSSGVFEPLDNAKGDCARVILYDYVVATSMSSPTVTITDIQTLLDWCALDPVDTYEMQRNDIVQTIEGCRNPFVDYPELAWKLFSSYTMPANMQTPSGNTVSYTVTANSNNNTYGTVSVNGCVITANPKTGYYAKDYTVTSGTASVTQNGNTFTVTPSTNCTVCINFAAKTAVTVTLNNNGSTSTKTGYAGDQMTLTMPTAPTGYTAVGWVGSTVSDSTTKPATVYTTSFTPTGSCTLYALFSHVVGGGGGSSTQFELYSGTITEGDYVITYQNGAMKAEVVNKRLGYTDVTVTNDVVSNPAASLIWHIAPSGSYWTIYNASANQYAASSGVKNNAALNSSGTDDKSLWTVTGSSAYEFENKYNKANSINALLRKNDTYGFATYSSSTGGALTLYKAGAGGTMYFTTVIGEPCDHTYTSVVTAPTCTAAGYTTYTCSECGYSYTGNEVAALGHNYGSFSHNASSNPSTHSKTCSRCSDKVTENCTFTSSTSGATTTFTCSVCHYSYQTTAQTFTVRYNVLGTVSSTASCVEGQSVNLPATATTVDGYTFAGWTTAAIGTETTAKPTVLTGSYKPTANVTLYALYTRTEAGGSGTSGYILSSAAPQDGDQIIIAGKNGSSYYAFKNDASAAGVSITVTDNVVTSPTTNLVWTVTNGTYGSNSGLSLSPSSNSSNYLHINSSALKVTTDRNNGIFEFTSAGSNTFIIHGKVNNKYLGFSSNSFSSASAGASLYIFKLSSGSGSTTYYTTNPTGETPHVHAYDSTGVCACGEKLISIDSAALKLDEDIDVIYNATVPEGTVATMTFTMNGETTTVSGDGSQGFVFEGVNPQCMGDNISATLTVTYGGKSYACTKASYSVKTYCTDMLAKSGTTTELRKLLSDTLAYGAAAQTYMSYKTNALVTSGVTGTSYSTFTALSGLAPVFTGTAAESPVWTGAYVTLTDNVNMVFRFASPNKTGLSVKVTYNGKTTTFSGTSITAVSGMSGVYEVKLTGIKATDFGQTVTAKFYKSSAQVGDTLGYSVNTYICAKQNDSNTALKNLVRTLYNYGASAAAYAG